LTSSMLSKRNFIIHNGPSEVNAAISANIVEELSLTDTYSAIVTHADGTTDEADTKSVPSVADQPRAHTAVTQVPDSQRFYFRDAADGQVTKSAIDLVEGFLNEIHAIVCEAEAKFGG
jgi:hypothetical protein